MKQIALAAAFVLELLAFVNFARLGLWLPGGKVMQLAASLALFGVLVWFWSNYMAPKAAHRLERPAYYAAKAVIYVLAAVVLAFQNSWLWGGVFAVAVIADEAILFEA